MAFCASQHTYLKVCLGSLVLSLLTHSEELCFVETSSFVGYAFLGYTQLFFSLLSLSSCKSTLFVFFFSSVLCLLNSSTVSLSSFLPIVFFSNVEGMKRDKTIRLDYLWLPRQPKTHNVLAFKSGCFLAVHE